MGWSVFWIGDFSFPADAPSRPLDEVVPDLETGTLEWVFYEANVLHLRRIADHTDESDIVPFRPLLRAIKLAHGTGELASIAWEDGPASFGFAYGLDAKKPRALTKAEIKRLFEANADPMREAIANPPAHPSPKGSKSMKKNAPVTTKVSAKKSGSANGADALAAKTEKGSTAKRAEALEELAKIDAPRAIAIARAWIVDEAIEEDASKGSGASFVIKTKTRPAAARVLATDPSDENLAALVAAVRIFALGPTYGAARRVLVSWTRPGIAAKIADEIRKTDKARAIACLLSVLQERGEVGDEAMLGRLARNPTAFPVKIENSVEGFQCDVIAVLLRTKAPSTVDVLCDVVGTGNFAQFGRAFESLFEDYEDEGPAIAKAVLASPRFPRTKLSAEALSAIEAMASKA